MSVEFCILGQYPGVNASVRLRRRALNIVPLDFPSGDAISLYLSRPSVSKYCSTVLVPLQRVIVELDRCIPAFVDIPMEINVDLPLLRNQLAWCLGYLVRHAMFVLRYF